MPSKEQKKLDKREQNMEKKQLEQKKMVEEKEWEKGTDKRTIVKKQKEETRKFVKGSEIIGRRGECKETKGR